jgi:hypothetical protein
MNTSTRDFPQGNIRVSDAERDRALAELSEHFQAGRLTQEEFDDRSGRALQARTGNELSGLFADLPRTPAERLRPTDAAPALTPAAAPAPAHACRRWSTARVVIACVVGSIVIGNVVGTVVVNTGHGVHQASFGWLIPVVVLLIVFRRIGR